MSVENNSEIIVAASGFFDPIHVGHIEYLKLAKEFANSVGGKLVVIVDDDKKILMKKGFEFMPWKERMIVVDSIKYVDSVFPSVDTELNIAKSLEALKPDYFVKGGDRTPENIPDIERDTCERLNIKMVFNLGKKIQSSSWLIGKLKN